MLSKNKKIDILNSAIFYIKTHTTGMCAALMHAQFEELIPYIGNTYNSKEIFPKFTRKHYNVYYKNIPTKVHKIGSYWDSMNEDGIKRRIKFLEYLKTTV